MNIPKAEVSRREIELLKIVNKLDEPLTVARLMKLTGYSRWFVEKTLIKNGVHYETVRNRKWNSENLAEIASALNAGNSYANVAIKFGISKQRLSAILRKGGYRLQYVKTNGETSVQTFNRSHEDM